MTPQTAASVAELARKAGVSVTTARRWRDSGCPRLPDGSFDVEAVVAWNATRVSDSHKTRGPESQEPQREDDSHWTTEFRKHKATLLEMEVSERRGELISVAEVERLNDAREVELRIAFQSLGARCAIVLEGKGAREIEATINDEVGKILNEYASRPCLPRGSGPDDHAANAT